MLFGLIAWVLLWLWSIKICTRKGYEPVVGAILGIFFVAGTIVALLLPDRSS